MSFIKRIFCRHKYNLIKENVTDFFSYGITTLDEEYAISYFCKKCGYKKFQRVEKIYIEPKLTATVKIGMNMPTYYRGKKNELF